MKEGAETLKYLAAFYDFMILLLKYGIYSFVSYLKYFNKCIIPNKVCLSWFYEWTEYILTVIFPVGK